MPYATECIKRSLLSKIILSNDKILEVKKWSSVLIVGRFSNNLDCFFFVKGMFLYRAQRTKGSLTATVILESENVNISCK
jgi:hypothetical protein